MKNYEIKQAFKNLPDAGLTDNEQVMCREYEQCDGCHYPARGFICWHNDGKCLSAKMKGGEKMIIQAEMRRKQSEYEGEACVVDKVVELPAQRFKQFSRALLAENDHVVETEFGRLRRLDPPFPEQTQGQPMFL